MPLWFYFLYTTNAKQIHSYSKSIFEAVPNWDFTGEVFTGSFDSCKCFTYLKKMKINPTFSLCYIALPTIALAITNGILFSSSKMNNLHFSTFCLTYSFKYVLCQSLAKSCNSNASAFMSLAHLKIFHFQYDVFSLNTLHSTKSLIVYSTYIFLWWFCLIREYSIWSSLWPHLVPWVH